MRFIKAKVLATGEEVTLVEKIDETGVFTEGFGGREFKEDELEVLGDLDKLGGDMPAPPKIESMDSTAMMRELVDSLKAHFWRGQRVEIAKILLRRENVDLSQVAEMADKIVQKLKGYGD